MTSLSDLLAHAGKKGSSFLELNELPKSYMAYTAGNLCFIDDKKANTSYVIIETFTDEVAYSVKISDRLVGHMALTMFKGGVPLGMVVRHFGFLKVLPACVSMYVRRKKKIVENTKPKPLKTPLFN